MKRKSVRAWAVFSRFGKPCLNTIWSTRAGVARNESLADGETIGRVLVMDDRPAKKPKPKGKP